MGEIPQVGEPAPFFAAATDGVERYSLDVVAGRWIVLMFFGTAGQQAPADGLALAIQRRELFNGTDAALFAVSIDPNDRAQRGLVNSDPGIRFFWDFDLAVTRLYGAADEANLQPCLFLIDPAFRIAMSAPIEATGLVLDRLEKELREAPGQEAQLAPVLTLPRIFEPEFCQALIAYYHAGGATESGFAKDVDGRTVQRIDTFLKRRSDVFIEDETVIAAIRDRLEKRLFPMIRRGLGWQPQHIERYLVSRYGDEQLGFFSRHRDDVTAGTAHRRFAVSLNLNDGYEGGELVFPEFGMRTYRPPPGGATVFSCNMLHEATPVTKGERFVFVPFLYDEEGARIRQRNLGKVAPDLRGNRQQRRAKRDR
ncbi:redoxin domain-containing protein [Phenylobacterium sp.]|uniref:redoxin domain-containing protein n=1 Tax=Phenylobacterium sp. TaxID=1871053 RepID=UPI0011F8EDE7|nr:redoxin domain-containing protein [Phenylobacterium sp.]THD59388.1 MAG: redoxin domain-containing protein [Phenylobacterium sp.]